MPADFAMPNGTVGVAYSHAVDLNGDFNLGTCVVPDGLIATRSGRSIVIHGTPTVATTGFDVRLGVTRCCCGGQQQSLKSEMTVAV
jgi:hypothetical protein